MKNKLNNKEEIKNFIAKNGFDFTNYEFNCEFRFSDYVDGNSISKEVVFSKCIFKKKVDFNKVKFQKKVAFTENNQTLEPTIFEEEVVFNGTLFTDIADFSLCIFNGIVTFSRASFLSDFLLEGISIGKYLDLSNITVDKSIILKGATFTGEMSDAIPSLKMRSALIRGMADLKDLKVKKAIFDYTKFEGRFELSKAEFYSYVSFRDVIFESKSKMYRVKFFGETLFTNSTFRDLIDFFGSEFHRPMIFYKTDFLSTSVFSRCTFKENVLFTYSLIDSVLIFRHAIFEKGLDLSLANNNGKINFFDTDLDIFSSVNHPDSIDEYEKCVSEEGKIPHKNKRETFRIIKKVLVNENNIIDSLEFQQKEMISYHAEINVELKQKYEAKFTCGRFSSVFKIFKYLLKPIITIYLFFIFIKKFILAILFKRKEYEESAQIQLSEISNNYGLSWLQGLLFTISISIFFFILYFFSVKDLPFDWGWVSFDSFWIATSEVFKSYFIFLLPTHRFNEFSSLNPTGLSYFIDIIARVFITYGIYQTVQAFRKFGKR